MEWHEDVPSTNDRAKLLARGGAPDRSVVAARTQGAGRGRGENPWASPRGGLYASLILRRVPSPLLPLLPLLAARVVHETLVRLVPSVPCWIKWPNDILAGPRGSMVPSGKVGGVLVESASTGDRLDWAVVGVGVNLASAPAELPAGLDPPALSYRSLVPFPPDPDSFLGHVLDRMDRNLGRFGADPAGLVADVSPRLAYRGAAVAVARAAPGRGAWTGILRGISPDGRAILRTDDGEVRVAAWEAAALRATA